MRDDDRMMMEILAAATPDERAEHYARALPFRFGFPTRAAAERHAAQRAAAGRTAIAFTGPDGVHVCAYGERSPDGIGWDGTNRA